MQYIEKDVRNSIQKTLDDNVVDSDFESHNSGENIYSLRIEMEKLESKLRAVFHSEKNAMVFEFSWINFCSSRSPTTQEVIEELQVYQEVRDEIEDYLREHPTSSLMEC
jgi:hypothetical protein